jgi:hypothetical protein
MKIIKNNLGENEYDYSNEFDLMKHYFIKSLQITEDTVDGLEYTEEIHNRLQSCSPKMVLVDMFDIMASSQNIRIFSQSYFDDCFDYVMNSSEDCFIQ